MMRWNSVVFPEPFGPTSPTLSPRFTARQARSSTAGPPGYA
jgi:hypothetical protein